MLSYSRFPLFFCHLSLLCHPHYTLALTILLQVVLDIVINHVSKRYAPGLCFKQQASETQHSLKEDQGSILNNYQSLIGGYRYCALYSPRSAVTDLACY